MSFRHSLLLSAPVAAALICAPALARETEAGDVARKLSDPANQIAATAVLAAMSEALLDLRVGPFMKALDSAGAGGDLADVPPDATVRDLAGKDAGRLTDGIARNTPRVMGAMAGMAQDLDAMLPQLRAMAERMRRSLPAE